MVGKCSENHRILKIERLMLAIEPVDMRLGIEGLSRLAQDHLHQSVGAGHAYAFTNRSRNRLKCKRSADTSTQKGLIGIRLFLQW